MSTKYVRVNDIGIFFNIAYNWDRKAKAYFYFFLSPIKVGYEVGY